MMKAAVWTKVKSLVLFMKERVKIYLKFSLYQRLLHSIMHPQILIPHYDPVMRSLDQRNDEPTSLTEISKIPFRTRVRVDI